MHVHQIVCDQCDSEIHDLRLMWTLKPFNIEKPEGDFCTAACLKAYVDSLPDHDTMISSS